MKDFLLSTPAQAVIWTTVLLILMAMSAYVLGRFRDRSDDSRQTANELLTNFQELHQQGDIEEAEYRTIKTVLGARLREELKDTESTG